MAFDGSRNYLLALELLRTAKGSDDEEVWLRAAIGRAYYAAFLKARAFLKDKDRDPNVPTNASAHFYVREAFRNSPDSKRKDIGDDLLDLRKARNKADYEGEYQNLAFNAPLLVAQAGAIIAAIDSL